MMVGSSAPEWLIPAFVRSVKALGAVATQAELEAVAERLIERWSAAERHFHCLSHLVHVLQRVDTLAPEVQHPELVRIAAWYHGAEFDTKACRGRWRVLGEDKPRSAELARVELLRLGVPDDVSSRVHELIMTLAHSSGDPGDADARALCDADRGMLADEPQTFKAYRARVRAEYAHLDPRSFIEMRLGIIDELLGQRLLFHSPLARGWEAAARQNLQAERAKLSSELEKLPPGDAVPATHEPEPEVRRAILSDIDVLCDDDSGRISPVERYHAHVSTPRSEQRGAQPVSACSPAAGDEAEVVGLPFEEQLERRAAKASELRTSEIEREPADPSSLPLRVPVSEKMRGCDRAGEQQSNVAPAKIIPVTEGPGDRGDMEGTGTLFRPVE